MIQRKSSTAQPVRWSFVRSGCRLARAQSRNDHGSQRLAATLGRELTLQLGRGNVAAYRGGLDFSQEVTVADAVEQDDVLVRVALVFARAAGREHHDGLVGF